MSLLAHWRPFLAGLVGMLLMAWLLSVWSAGRALYQQHQVMWQIVSQAVAAQSAPARPEDTD